jgi:hypothetical protein
LHSRRAPTDAARILDRVSWTKADSDDAWLAFDRNGNGRIDDGSELFGDHSPSVSAAVHAKNGFEALKFLEAPAFGPSRPDMQIDQRDAAFAGLLLWTDRNHNGISEADELQRACESGLVAIGTDYQERKRRDAHGNQFRLKGESWWVNARGNVRKDVVWDVWLRAAR